MPRTLSIWLPQLPLDRLVRQGDPRLGGVFAITAEDRNAWRITYPNVQAAEAGLQAGQSLADARAICPDLLTEPSDEAREGLLLRALWRWADCLSPRVAPDPPDGLLLDISGCAHLFGGERAMAEHARLSLKDLSIQSKLGIADTKMGARALARYGEGDVAIAPVGGASGALADLPIAALGLSQKMTSELARAGLTQLTHLYEQKTSALARRFGLELTKALGAATGFVPDPVTLKSADPVYAARMTLPEPIGFVEDLEHVLKRLSKQVCKRLSADQKGARQFHLTVRCVDTGDHYLAIGFARPCADPGAIERQFAHPLSKLEIEYGADWFRLSASGVEPVRFKQMSIGEESKQRAHRQRLVEVIGNRIGFDHVRVFSAKDAHLPEHEFEQIEAVEAEASWMQGPRVRPVRLFTPPEFANVEIAGRPPKGFKWRRMSFATHTADGPERITPRWFCDEDLRMRDYWRVQTEEGRRFWLMTYPGAEPQDWYVAGEFP